MGDRNGGSAHGHLRRRLCEIVSPASSVVGAHYCSSPSSRVQSRKVLALWRLTSLHPIVYTWNMSLSPSSTSLLSFYAMQSIAATIISAIWLEITAVTRLFPSTPVTVFSQSTFRQTSFLRNLS